jgi:thioredoxin reductase
MRHDVIIIGGSFAGLSAAIYLARARRSVLIIDAGKPRNRFAAHSHGFLAQDGAEPSQILATARAQVIAYPTVTILEGTAVSAAQSNAGFDVTLSDGQVLHAGNLVLAYGLRDELPAIPGLVERWGKSVIHCPYCHGFEFADQRLGVLATSPHSVHHAMLIPQWGPTTYFLNGHDMPDAAMLTELSQRGVTIETEKVVAVLGEGDAVHAVALADGRQIAIDALYAGPQSHHNCEIAAQLDLAMDAAPWGQMIRTDGFKMTSVKGVYAAGDIARGGHAVAWAVADGVTAGVSLHRSLVFPA